MKRMFCLILALVALTMISVPVYAENEVVITANVTESYVIKIPEATTNLSFGITTAQAFGTIGLQSAKLLKNHQVTISVNGNDGLVNSLDGDKKIEYTIMDGGNAFSSASFTDTTLKTLTIIVEQAQWDAASAGSYSDTVTFTATVTEIGS